MSAFTISDYAELLTRFLTDGKVVDEDHITWAMALGLIPDLAEIASGTVINERDCLKELEAMPRKLALVDTCGVCGFDGDEYHKCCSKCGTTASSEVEIKQLFGWRACPRRFATQQPQGQCRSCRTSKGKSVEKGRGRSRKPVSKEEVEATDEAPRSTGSKTASGYRRDPSKAPTPVKASDAPSRVTVVEDTLNDLSSDAEESKSPLESLSEAILGAAKEHRIKTPFVMVEVEDGTESKTAIVRKAYPRTVQAEDDILRTGSIDFGAVVVPVMDAITVEGASMLAINPLDPHYQMDPVAAVVLANALVHDEPTWFWGPTGAGKTSDLLHIAALLGWPVYRVNLKEGFGIEEFVGTTEVVIDEATGQAVTRFVDGILPRAMFNNGILLIDEVTAATPGILLALQAVLELRGEGEQRRRRYVNTDNQGEVFEAGEFFRIVVTDNTNGQGDITGLYAGTNVMNSAFRRRFSQWFNKGYPDPKTWAEIVHNKTGCGKRIAAKIVKVATKMNEGSSVLGASAVTNNMVICPADTIDIGRLYGTYKDMKLAWAIGLLNSLYPSDPDRQTLSDAITNIIGTEF